MKNFMRNSVCMDDFVIVTKVLVHGKVVVASGATTRVCRE